MYVWLAEVQPQLTLRPGHSASFFMHVLLLRVNDPDLLQKDPRSKLFSATAMHVYAIEALDLRYSSHLQDMLAGP